MKGFLRMNVAVFVILMLILTTTLGLVAIKQQQFADIMPRQMEKATYLSLPHDIKSVNPGEETKTVELLKRLLETVVLSFAAVYIFVSVTKNNTVAPEISFFRLPVKDKVVLLE